MAAESPRGLLAHGAGRIEDMNPIWVALMDAKGQQESTTVFYRSKLGDRDWVQMAQVPARAVDITNYSTELVLLLKSAMGPAWQWVIVSSRGSIGPALPGRNETEVLAMAGDRTSLYALTRPAAAASATTAPTTRPTYPQLYRLVAGETWAAQPAEWPADVEIGPQNQFSMALIGHGTDGRPTVAVSTADGAIQLLQFVKDRWNKLEKIAMVCGHIKLLNLNGRAALWCQGTEPQESAGGIWKQETGQLVPLAISGPLPKPGDVDLAVTGDGLSLFMRREGKVLEQRYDAATLKPVDQLVELRPRLRTEDQFQQWISVAVMAVLSILILNVLLRRRAASRDDREDDRSDEE